MRITGVPMTVIGVLPAEFTGIDPSQGADLRAPLSMAGEVRAGPRRGPPLATTATTTIDGRSQVIVVGRLREGVSMGAGGAGNDGAMAALPRIA